MKNTLLLFLLMIFVNACKPPSPMDKPLGNSVNNLQNNPKECSDFKTSTDCKHIGSKECLWGAGTCYENTPAIKTFMSTEKNFASTLHPSTVLGSTHGINVNWAALCQNPDATKKSLTHNNDVLINARQITFKFKKDLLEVDLILDCAPAFTTNDVTNKIYTFSYAPINVVGGIKIQLKTSQTVMAVHDGGGVVQSNQLDFFTKGDWFFVANENRLKGSMQIDYIFGNTPHKSIDTVADINSAIAYQQAEGGAVTDYDGHYNIDANTGAVSFIFSSI